MRYAGVDIGSRSIELAILDESTEVRVSRQTETGFDPLANVRGLIEDQEYDTIMATGYGRSLFEVAYEATTVTEIRAHAEGVRHFYPEARTVLDIGGQDSKAIAIGESGRVKKFEMNDRCAAGTGRFLEIMAQALGFNIDEFGSEALHANSSISISSMCTVFAESEVTSLIAKGMSHRDIAHGLHQSIVQRVAGMIKRVLSDGDLVFTGGVARNACVVSLLGRKLERRIVVPADPQMIGAIGAALLARKAAMATA
jgi:predicted CoA-substrate-specific enzyme activase